jgi:site-specific recombinase XerD
MSVYKPKGREEYLYDFWLNGRRFHGNTEKRERREALKVEEEERHKARVAVKAEKGRQNAPLTLDVAIGRYWIEWGQHQAKQQDFKRDFARLIEFFGKDRLLSDITDDDVTRLVAWRRGHRAERRYRNKNDPRAKKQPLLSPGQVNRSSTEMLRRLFVRARKKWKIRYDSEPDWREHLLPEPQERVRELRTDEDAALTQAMDPDYDALRQFSLASGLRRNESLLRWSQVDFSGGKINTKGKGGRAISIPISSEMRAILLTRVGHDPECVFTYVAKRAGKAPMRVRGKRYPITVYGLKTHWRRSREVAGVKDFRWHDNRHDFGTKLLRATGNLKLVQRGLNHRNIATTAKYAHVVDDDLRRGMEAMIDQKSQPKSQHPKPKTA